MRLDPFPPHVDHVIARKHGGRTTIRVLAINAGRRIAARTQLMAEGAY